MDSELGKEGRGPEDHKQRDHEHLLGSLGSKRSCWVGALEGVIWRERYCLSRGDTDHPVNGGTVLTDNHQLEVWLLEQEAEVLQKPRL